MKAETTPAPFIEQALLARDMKISKYTRYIDYVDASGKSHKVPIDVYSVLKAFDVRCPATQHAAKKVLCTGIRGHKDALTDLNEAIASIERAIELNLAEGDHSEPSRNTRHSRVSRKVGGVARVPKKPAARKVQDRPRAD